jgi:hypothetical protein
MAAKQYVGSTARPEQELYRAFDVVIGRFVVDSACEHLRAEQ